MNSVEALTWIGTGITLISMGITAWQASRAISAAKRAEEVRDEIENRNADHELSDLNGMLTPAIRAMDKYGPGTGTISLKGSSPDSDAATVRALTGKMQQVSNLLEEKVGEDASEVITRVNLLLNEFGNASNDVERRQHGHGIYNEITEFSGNLHSVIGQRIYKRKS